MPVSIFGNKTATLRNPGVLPCPCGSLVRSCILKTNMKKLLIALVTALTFNSASAQVPQFRPDLGCTYLSTVTEYFPLVGGGTESHSYYVFLMRASSDHTDGLVEVQFWREGQSKNALLLRDPEFNNIGKNCLQNVTLDDVLAYSGYGPSQVANEGARVRWYVWTAQNNHGSDSIDWDVWLANNTTLCDDEDDWPTRIACMDANDDICGFYTISGWNTSYTNWNFKYYVPLNVTGWASMGPLNGYPDTRTGGAPSSSVYWSNTSYSWAVAISQMNVGISSGQLFK